MITSQTPTEAKTWFITGASSGIGRELVLAALGRGDSVAALSRKTAPLDDLAREYPNRLLLLSADVADEAAVTAAVSRTVENFGTIDIVANNAGYGLFGGVEEATDTQARAIFDTNVFGVLNVLRATLPVLRAQRSGLILQGSSLYGQFAHPGVGMLAATKFAVEGLSEALAQEVAPLGIKVSIVQPGATETPFLANLAFAEPIEAYDGTVRAVQKAIGEIPAGSGIDPAAAVAALMAVVDSDTPPLRIALGEAGADQMRAALNGRLTELDAWSTVTASADKK
ncbi:SDR family NAD(P)-dependent oxidoreductase [Arthrobacter crusticola]|uniref:SDR family NAD(P)-dependent oxidoreductase n=1 Tax=Arthrobacter crusticola TaxID=2547960 RepID=A0A4R5TVQ7_9MICC|nr:SDR family NAD(P)-dependent oxidoreductase [Arthrobacter crusticola]TDK25215.1 SDR family NAD(P)-dependent oxidoreductase [Arthrobacter crusticola]